MLAGCLNNDEVCGMLAYADIGVSRSQDANDEFFLATDPGVAKSTGKCFVSRRERRMPSVVQDERARKKLWDLLVEQTGCDCP